MQITLKAARVNSGLTQKSAAKQLNISEDRLYNFESGRSIPNGIMLQRMLELYNIQFSDINFNCSPIKTVKT